MHKDPKAKYKNGKTKLEELSSKSSEYFNDLSSEIFSLQKNNKYIYVYILVTEKNRE